MNEPRSELLFGLPTRVETLAEAVDRIDHRIESRKPTIHAVVNAAKVSRMSRDAEFFKLMASFDMIHADGTSIVWAARWFGTPLPERVAGIDLMQALVARGAQRGYSVFLLGARPNVVQVCAQRLVERNPGLKIAGVRDGYWDANDPVAESQVVTEIRESGADMLFVAIPTPRKEVFLAKHRSQLGVPFAMGVGGAFDVVAGTVNRAPVAWQRAGMEWAYRLVQEPRKMWKRYLVTNTHFLWLVAKELLRGRGAPASRRSRNSA